MDSYVIQSKSGQDYAGHATFQDTHYSFVFDGHGYNHCIDHIRTLDMNLFATLPCPPTALEHSFVGKDFYKSGATFVLARIKGNLLEVFHVGDAKARVFVNDALVHETVDHTFLHPEEISRTTATILHEQGPFPISDSQVDMMDSPRGLFTNGDSFVPSQALGHNAISGLHPGHFVLEFKPYDSVRVVCGSDGFWDMLPGTNGTAKELCEHALKRWKQKWLFQGNFTTFDSPDDISVALLVHSPVVCIPYSLCSFTEEHVRNAFPFPIYKVDTIIRDRKIFFLHFKNICHDLRELLKNISIRKVKLYYHDDWFWHLTLRSSCLEQRYLDSDCSLDDYISDSSALLILKFKEETQYA